ncbi:MAG: complement C1q domain-containing protein [Oscillospiraceae bacterium]|nr:complement C1q domain-containing protein [Oscillospiraceae bacterium]
MAYFLQLERTTGGAIEPEANIVFDNEIRNSGEFSYDDTTGIITCNKTGDYIVNWFVVQQTGLSKTGGNFTLQTSFEDIVTSESGSSSHFKVAPTSGFAVISIADAGETIQLINPDTINRATLSGVTAVTAGLMIYGAGEQSLSSSGMQVQLDTPTILLDEAFVPFNDIITPSSSADISYDIATSTFTLKPGTYLVTWEVPVDGTDTKAFVNLSLFLDGIQKVQSFIPVSVGIVAGSSLVVVPVDDVTGEPSTLQLVNTTDDTISITGLANIVIVKTS